MDRVGFFDKLETQHMAPRASALERRRFNSLWKYIYNRHPTISEPGAKLAASAAIEWFERTIEDDRLDRLGYQKSKADLERRLSK